MQSAATQYVNDELGLLFQYNPPTRSEDPKAAHKLRSPLTFYDKHLDAKLSLKRVEIIPLATYLSHAVDRTIQYLKDGKISLPSQHPGDLFPSQAFRAPCESEHKASVIDANALAVVHQQTAAFYSRIVASTLLFHVRAPGWFSILKWNQVEYQDTDGLHAFNEEYALQIHDLDAASPKIQDCIDEETRVTLQHVQKRYCGLAYWGFFAISREAESVLKEMDGVALAEYFNYEICRTKGYPSPQVVTTVIPDASVTGWGTPVASLCTPSNTRETSGVPQHSAAVEGPMLAEERPLRRSTRAHITPLPNSKKSLTSRKDVVKVSSEAGPAWSSVTIPIRSNGKPSMVNMFFQRAWAKAVERDSTYVILNCGNRERIGFRHRSSQTLFLSDLIDVPHCKDPGYGKIHIGLHLSILQDVIDRTKQECKQDEMLPSNNRKRRRGTIDATPNKRYKTRAMILRERREGEERQKNHQTVKREADKRHLVLLELRYGIYNSPAPASFLRLHCKRKDTYAPHEYISIVLTSKIAAGATGVAHRAYLETPASDSDVSRTDVVVKLSLKYEQAKRLRHEFSIYKHLASHGVVEGVPVVYGLFEDVETDALALVMSDVGTALVTVLPDDESYGATISESTKTAYLRVLGTIHKAGVRHHDIRPENLMLTDNDQVAIIDFDMAELDPSEGAMRREMLHMTELLTGSYYPPNQFPSPATTLEKEPTPEKQFTPKKQSTRGKRPMPKKQPTPEELSTPEEQPKPRMQLEPWMIAMLDAEDSDGDDDNE